MSTMLKVPPLESPYRDIWRLTWPQMLMMVAHFLIGFVDVWVAGRIHSEVQASMGMINQLLFFFLVVAVAVANGSVAAISQSLGAGLHKRILRFVGLVLQIGVVTGALLFVVGSLCGDLVLSLLQVPDRLMPVMRYFYNVFMFILPCYYLFIITNAIFRAQKMVMVPLFAMIAVTLINTVGDLGFGLGWWGLPDYGYRGLAWSTFASVFAGMLFNLAMLFRLRLLVRTGFAPWCWVKRALPYLYKVAWPGGLMQIVWHSAYMVLFAITASLPAGNITALAGMTAGLRVESFLFLPGFAFNFTAGILVGQFLGAGRPDLAKQYGYKILLMGEAVICVLTLFMWLVIDPVTQFIAPDPAVQAESVNYLIYNMLAIPFTLAGMILAGGMNGAGATLYNLLIMGSCAWFVRIPLAWFLGHRYLGAATGIWIAMLTSQVIQAMFALYVFQFWDWSRFGMIKRKRNSGGVKNAAV